MTTPAPDDATVRVGSATMPSSARARQAQFAPGTTIAGRYRIAGILGSGGMGEVYRADDTKLDQPVALKFLPARLARDPILLARLHDEVRLGRQIAHPNVCRIYDIAEANGMHFVAMEYVDGEDLARLLRRIGRIAHDKAVDIARGIAAGLAAAHAKGILHRDLKPANVMVDSRGEAKVMDFGLALGAGEDDRTISGTPAYMAPEQLEGRPATVQSDLYALGLVMYELFTGRRAHAARSVQERTRDLGSAVTTPSEVVRDIDPAVERIILRCLDADPGQRPRSAREVIEQLPGGDPLAAALAAGETPSPRIVAAAGAEGSLSPRAAWSLLGAVAVLLVLYLLLHRTTSYTRYFPAAPSPEVLRERANEIPRTLGVPTRGNGRPWFDRNVAYHVWLDQQRGDRKWERLARGPALIVFRVEYGIDARAARVVSRFANAPGWTAAELDLHGRLSYLLAAPAPDAAARPLDWRPLLAAAGLDPATLRSVEPAHVPATAFDARAAWSGTYPGDTTPIRIEAAAWRGTPVFFRITGPWDERGDPWRSMAFENPAAQRFGDLLVFIVVGFALLLGWRNLRLRRGDRQGALRMASVIFALLASVALFEALRIGPSDALAALVAARLGEAALQATFFFMMYVALEPYARRRWPEQLIAWARLVGGRVRDPLVGRHILIGITGGIGHVLFAHGATTLAWWVLGGDRPLSVYTPSLGIAHALARLSDAAVSGIRAGFLAMIALALLTMLLRKRPLAVAALFLLSIIFFVVAAGPQLQSLPALIVVASIIAFVTTRYGLLAVTALQTTSFVLMFVGRPVGPDWMVSVGLIPIAAVSALALWAFRTSLGGQSPFSASLLDE